MGTILIVLHKVSGVTESNLQVFGQVKYQFLINQIFPNYGNSSPVFTLAAFSGKAGLHYITVEKTPDYMIIYLNSIKDGVMLNAKVLA